MKLIACHIDNFGKLSDLSLEFKDGLNVIYESNAWGKSTLAAFLKAMFYGLDAKKEAKAYEKERVLYRPWQGGAFGGELDFEVEGKSYRISRTFGRTEKTDEFHLYDLSTNLECKAYSRNIGQELFDIDASSFKRTIYIAQNDCACETSDSINAKLGNLAQNTDDINNFESAMRCMKEKLNQLTPERITGSIKKRKNYITELMQELRTYESADEGMVYIREKIHTLSSQIQELINIRRNYSDALLLASEESQRKVLFAQYHKLCQETEEKKKKLEELSVCFPKGIPSVDEFKEQIQLAQQMDVTEMTTGAYELTIEECELLCLFEERYGENRPTDKQIEESLQMLVEIEKQKEELVRQENRLSELRMVLDDRNEEPKLKGTIAIVLVIAGIALLQFAQRNIFVVAGNVILLCGVLFLFIAIIKNLRERKKEKDWKKGKKEQYDALERTVSIMKQDIQNAYDIINTLFLECKISCAKEEYSIKLYEIKNELQEYDRLCQKEIKRSNAKENIIELFNKINVFMEKYAFESRGDFSDSLNQLQAEAMEVRVAQRAYQELLDKKEEFENNQSPSFWSRQAVCPYCIEELNEMIQNVDVKIEELKQSKTQYERQLEDLQSQMDTRDERRIELQEQLEQQERDATRYQTVSLAYEYMQRAKEQLAARYMEPIQKSLIKYVQILTEECEENMVVDANIEVKVHEQGELRDVRSFSAGYQDLIGICMRLALVDAMYEKEKPFLILDDPFVNLDGIKIEGGISLLQSVAKEYQIIYFTCHDSRRPK